MTEIGNKDILVTGSNGFIGTVLCKKLQTKGFSLTEVYYPQFDLTVREDIDKIAAYCKNKNFAGIIHLAGIVPKQHQTQEEQDRDFLKNIIISLNVSSLVPMLSIPVLVNFSSVAVYPQRDGTYREDGLVCPAVNQNGMYGLAKLCSENIFDYHLASKGVRCVHLRIGQIYGGEITGNGDQLYQQMSRELKEYNQIEVYANGQREGNFVHIDALCDIVINSLLQSAATGVINIGPEHMSYLQFAEKLIRQFGDANSKIILSSKGQKTKFALDTQKMSRLFTSDK